MVPLMFSIEGALSMLRPHLAHPARGARPVRPAGAALRGRGGVVQRALGAGPVRHHPRHLLLVVAVVLCSVEI